MLPDKLPFYYLHVTYDESPTAGTMFDKIKFSLLIAFHICFKNLTVLQLSHWSLSGVETQPPDAFLFFFTRLSSTEPFPEVLEGNILKAVAVLAERKSPAISFVLIIRSIAEQNYFSDNYCLLKNYYICTLLLDKIQCHILEKCVF